MESQENNIFSTPKTLFQRNHGPPNRMNDLPYREWMKFQKSFFRHRSMETLAIECIEFFTKAVWPTSSVSKSLLVGFAESDRIVSKPRMLARRKLHDLNSLDSVLDNKDNRTEKYDFILINLRNRISSHDQLWKYLQTKGEMLFSKIRNLLADKMYGCFIVDYGKDLTDGIPYPWIFGSSLRTHLRLRDEKIGIVEKEKKLYYCIFFQASDDQINSRLFSSNNTILAKSDADAPVWLLPKSPPRSKDEIFHPAKFPEGLVDSFISHFTKPDENVFDPMAGTGSAMVSAAQLKRNGLGVELNPEFVSIANKRIEKVSPSVTLFKEEKRPSVAVIEGDARNLDHLKLLHSWKFDYCITSPPYWSILHNVGSEYQRSRRTRNLPQTYSFDKSDLSNIPDYDDFVVALVGVYDDVAKFLRSGAYLTVVVKNIKRNHIVYTLAWELVQRLCQRNSQYEFAGNTFWLQDDVPMRPFAVGIHWVSNVVHQYCLHFRRK